MNSLSAFVRSVSGTNLALDLTFVASTEVALSVYSELGFTKKSEKTKSGNLSNIFTCLRALSSILERGFQMNKKESTIIVEVKLNYRYTML